MVMTIKLFLYYKQYNIMSRLLYSFFCCVCSFFFLLSLLITENNCKSPLILGRKAKKAKKIINEPKMGGMALFTGSPRIECIIRKKKKPP
jgi:hypothetical protein